MQEGHIVHDLFISYAEADRAWVEGYLLDALTQAGVSCHSEATFALGVPRLLEFEHAVQQSRRVLLVLSPAYLAEDFTRFTDLLAQSYGLENATWPVIPLILHPVKLPPRLAMLTALEATNPADWSAAVDRLCAELQRPTPPPASKPPCPYPGLLPFSEANSDRFFGRDREVQELLERLRLHPFLTIIGPSGSGKSSLVHAGLIPQLRQSDRFGIADWYVLTLRPGPQPLQRLAAVLGSHLPEHQANIADRLAQEPGSLKSFLSDIVATATQAGCLLLVDQFEELFVQCKDAVQRRTFLERLREVIQSPPDRCLIVLAVRADFYADCQESILWPYMETSLLNLPPLTREGLRRAIEQPAQATGVYLEPTLVERLLDDAADEKGVLPLLQETLVLLWSRFLRRRLLTLADYEALGNDGRNGMQVALSRWADTALAGLTGDEQRTVARRIFLRLVEFGEGRNDTRRQQPVTALVTEADAKQVFQSVLEHLVQHRLLTTGSDIASGTTVVDLAHEKLIEAWSRLRNWVESYQTMEAMRRSLVLAATAWHENKQDSSYLFTGRRLRQAVEWAKQWGAELCTPERAFLSASQTLERQRHIRNLVTTISLMTVVVATLTFLSRTIYRERVRHTIGTELVAISGGPSIIGTDDPAAAAAERPAHIVTLLPFQIEKYEVSNHQYRACVQFGPCTLTLGTASAQDLPDDNYPVVMVTAQQAHVYCTWLGRRLPTTVEWERTVRGTDGRWWPWGNAPLPGENYEFPFELLPINSASETASPEGVYHLVDNVSEWGIRVSPNCISETCHLAWDGKSNAIAWMGGAYDRNIDRVTQVADPAFNGSSSTIPDESIGFRCVADNRP